MTITLIIIVLTCLVSFSAFSNEKLMNDLIFYPPAISRNNQWYRFFSCGLIHADFFHLLFNMYALYLFGTAVERAFVQLFGTSGKLVYLAMYVLALGACLIPTYKKNKDNSAYRSLGASGAVSAVIFVYIVLDPLNGLGLIIIPRLYVAGFIFGALYLAISSWLDKRGGGNINHSAHIYGAVFGILFLIVACYALSDYRVIESFIEKVKELRPNNIIYFA
jgi:membrane associated rhomboid family serine protease